MSQGLVIPCYNEEHRLPLAEVIEFIAGAPEVTLLFVDDGSTDGTRALIERLSKESPKIKVLVLEKNGGKAEAVRQGLLRLVAEGCDQVGYADADFATPAFELVRLLNIFSERKPEVLMGSRVRLLGTDIERRAMRHYLGRVFATLASLALRLPVYDTQCGAKFFLVTENFVEAIRQPFTSRWAFDVELLSRLSGRGQLKFRGSIVEVPLQKWTDVAGSKLRLSSMLKAGLDLIRIGLRFRRT